MSIMADVLLTQHQAADRYCVTTKTLQRWRTQGVGPRYIRIGSRQVRYREADCDAYDARQSFNHRADELAQVVAA